MKTAILAALVAFATSSGTMAPARAGSLTITEDGVRYDNRDNGRHHNWIKRHRGWDNHERWGSHGRWDRDDRHRRHARREFRDCD